MKDFLAILACPHCHGSLKKSAKQLFCVNKDCKKKFPVQQGIPILLPSGLEKLPDATFKKAQLRFFDKWSSKSRGKTKSKESPFSRFFSSIVGGKKINYAEKAMDQLIKKIPKNSWVLELGCGAGEHTAFLAQIRKDVRLVALDLSLKSVLETKARLKKEKIKSRVSFVVADVEALPFKEKALAGIVGVMLLHHLAHLRKTIGEIKRTLHPKGTALIVDITANNPFIVLPRKIFPRLPYHLKKRFKKDYLLESGETPRVSPHKIGKIKQTVKKAKLKIIKEEPYDLFLIALDPLGRAFPFLQHLFPESILNFLYNIEKRLLKKYFFQRFAGAIVLWISH